VSAAAMMPNGDAPRPERADGSAGLSDGPAGSRSALDAALVIAHAAGEGRALVGLYAAAADSHEAAGDIDAACFFLTQAYVFALETDHPAAAGLHRRLKARAREE
jgi:hypothetical protein